MLCKLVLGSIGLVCNNLMSALLLYSKYIFGLDLLVSTFNFTMVTLT